MVDGVKIFYPIQDFDSWRREINIEFHSLTDLSTGSVKTKIRERGETISKTVRHEGIFETFRLSVSESDKRNVTTGNECKSVNLEISGSLHKNHFNGQNYSPFHWDQLQDEIVKICQSLKLNENKAVLQNLEFGVNIQVPFSPFEFLEDNLLLYKRNKFDRYNTDSEGKCLGYVYKTSQYSVKIYDKGLQHDLFPDRSDCGLMRFEIRYTKMQQLNRIDIRTMSDLKDIEKINRLKLILMRSWNDVLIFDPSISIKSIGLKDRKDQELLKDGHNSRYWQRLKKDANRNVFNYQRNKFKKLVHEYGKGLHQSLANQISNQWDELFKNSANLPGGNSSIESQEFSKFTLKVKGNIAESRFCKWCRSDISNQKLGSRFCGPKFQGGKEVNRCRDKFRRARDKYQKAKSRKQGKLFP